jgi:hypothetical protein
VWWYPFIISVTWEVEVEEFQVQVSPRKVSNTIFQKIGDILIGKMHV